jgi:hypothetical protein
MLMGSVPSHAERVSPGSRSSVAVVADSADGYDVMRNRGTAVTSRQHAAGQRDGAEREARRDAA